MSLAKLPDLDTRIQHAQLIILLGQRPLHKMVEVDQRIATEWGCAAEDVDRVFVEAWRRLRAEKSRYRAVVMQQIDDIMRWDPLGKNRLGAALGALQELREAPPDPGPQKHVDRVAAYRQALRDPDDALREALELEGFRQVLTVDEAG